MNLGDEYQKFLIFIALAITVDEGWAIKIQLIIPTKFINSNEGGRWSSSLLWEPSLIKLFFLHDEKAETKP